MAQVYQNDQILKNQNETDELELRSFPPSFRNETARTRKKKGYPCIVARV